MSGLFSNKFTVELNDVARIVFIDERAAISSGIPASSKAVAEIVMTHDNLRQLGELIDRLLKERK